MSESIILGKYGLNGVSIDVPVWSVTSTSLSPNLPSSHVTCVTVSMHACHAQKSRGSSQRDWNVEL